MKNVGPITASLLAGADRHGIVEADLVVWNVKTFAGAAKTFAFWTEHDTETGTVTSPFTGLPHSYPFVGAGAILEVGETPRTSDLSIRRKSITMSAVHETVLDMWTGHDMRLAQVAFYQAIFDPDSRNMVEALLEFVGELNGAPKEVPVVGGQGGIRFDCVSDTRQLTRTNSAKRAVKPGDGFYRYVGVSSDWKIPFGQASS